MRGRAVALIAATAVSAGAAATAAMAASGPPPPPKASNGHPVQLVASGLNTPTSFAFGGGNVFEGDGGAESKAAPPNGGVFVLKGGAATEIPGSPQFVAGLAWHRGALYVSGGSITATGPKWQLWKWSGWNGTTFTSQKAIYTAPKKFQGFNGLAFGADGRLYVGVDTGLLNNNDHGPANLSPYLYDILSFNANGQGLKVFASGIRQPWQMAFPAARRHRSCPTSDRTAAPRTRRTSSSGFTRVTTSGSRAATGRRREAARATPSHSSSSVRTPI